MLVSIGRRLHTYDGPSESLKTKMAELEKMRKSNSKSTKKQKRQVFVEVPEPLTYLDTATMPMYLAAAGMALFAKLLMMVKLTPMSLIISTTPFVNLPSIFCVFVTLLRRICFSLKVMLFIAAIFAMNLQGCLTITYEFCLLMLLLLCNKQSLHCIAIGSQIIMPAMFFSLFAHYCCLGLRIELHSVEQY